jgi:predicted MFS family arabinose efflux permease
MERRGQGDSVLALAAIILLACAGAESLGLAPLIVSALTEQAGFSAEEAGRCVSAEGAGNLFGALIVILFARRVSQRSMATWALMIIMAGNVGCLWAASFGGYVTLRLIAGVGGGLATSAYGMLAGTRQATRNYAINSMSSVLLVAVSGAIVPLISKFVGANSLFVLITLVALLALGASPWLPSEKGNAGTVDRGDPAREGRASAAILSILTTLFYFTAILAFWSYVAEIGAHHDLSPVLVAETLSVSFLVSGVAGSLLVAAFGGRAPPRLMILLCTLVTGLSICAVILRPEAAAYVSAVPIFILAWFVIYPFLMGLMARIDPTGRLAILGMLSQMAGGVAGPLLGSVLSRPERLPLFAGACAGGILISLVCAVLIDTRFFTSRSRQESLCARP